MSFTRHQAVGAYRRWEPTDFDADGRPPLEPAPPPMAAPALPAGPEPLAGLQLPTAEDIERMHEEIRAAAFAEGRAEGQAVGHAAGLEAGRSAGYAEGRAQAEAEAAQLAALAGGLEQALGALDREVAEELMALAIELARQMVRQTLERHPETILDTVRAALQQLPQAQAQICLHPEDLALVREHLGEQLAHAGHRLQEDFELGRGDCRIDTPAAQLDATLETRWRRVLESLGRDAAHWHARDEAGPA